MKTVIISLLMIFAFSFSFAENGNSKNSENLDENQITITQNEGCEAVPQERDCGEEASNTFVSHWLNGGDYDSSVIAADLAYIKCVAEGGKATYYVILDPVDIEA